MRFQSTLRFLHTIAIGFFAATLPASAQVGNHPSNAMAADWEQTSYLAPQLGYLSDNVYLGRKDSAALPYFSPAIHYHSRSGFDLSTALNFTNAGGPLRIDLWQIDAGYMRMFGDHWLAGGDAGLMLYSKKSENVRADNFAYADAFAGYVNDFLTPSVTLTALIGRRMDYVATLQAEHEFSLLDDRLTLTPTVACNAGTQRYYTGHMATRINKKGNSVNRMEYTGTAQFSLLDYELSLPVGLEYRAFHFDFIPTYFIPVNPASLHTPTTTYNEALSNGFVAEVRMEYRLPLKK